MVDSLRAKIKVGVEGQRERVPSADVSKAETWRDTDLDALQKRDRGSATTT